VVESVPRVFATEKNENDRSEIMISRCRMGEFEGLEVKNTYPKRDFPYSKLWY